MKQLDVEHRILQGLLIALGVPAILIALMIFTFGSQSLFIVESGYESLLGEVSFVEPEASATVDSEMRFYSSLWFSYGLLLIWIASGIVQRQQFVPIVAVIFFAGGLGRVLSFWLAGAPHPAFIVLIVIELVYPVLLFILHLRLQNRQVA